MVEHLSISLCRNHPTDQPPVVATKAQLPEYIKLHSLRHTFAARLLALGVDISIVSKLPGHSTLTTTMIYATAPLDTLRGAIRMLEELEDSNRLATREGGGQKLLGE